MAGEAWFQMRHELPSPVAKLCLWHHKILRETFVPLFQLWEYCEESCLIKWHLNTGLSLIWPWCPGENYLLGTLCIIKKINTQPMAMTVWRANGIAHRDRQPHYWQYPNWGHAGQSLYVCVWVGVCVSVLLSIKVDMHSFFFVVVVVGLGHACCSCPGHVRYQQRVQIHKVFLVSGRSKEKSVYITLRWDENRPECNF